MLEKKIIKNTLALLIISSIPPSHASNNDNSGTAFTVSLGAASSPKYSGSNEQTWGAAPQFHFQQDNFFVDSMNGAGFRFQSKNGLYFIPTIGYDSGRTDEDSGWRKGSDTLKGMGDISATVNTGLALGWAVTPWLVLEGKATLPLSDGQGISYATSVDFIPVLDEEDTVALKISALFADSRYMNTWYGVNSTQSANSGYSRYTSSGGYYGTDVSLTWAHQFTETWGGWVGINHTWLGDNAASSPIVKQKEGTTGVVAISYTF
ncbi:MipA/OmpV family protein [Serratia marcescens]|jgi:outer membrane protein|uniref:MipA/OmpV family protein n=1 Tax=Serratia TaxID=613 RepID=UPI0018D7A520|nr:MipA/OmpV family protein [Serratia marcescens]MBH2970697.1 MipA/OmpV family protein [Serratia marcescens]MBN6138639.1 MipA/OmpV family protein [Serratia marcescens]